MSKLLNAIGWIVIIGGVIGAIFMADVTVLRESTIKSFGLIADKKFSWLLFFTYAIGSVLSGIVFLALSSISRRTEENQSYLHEIMQRTPALPEQNKLPNTKMNLTKLEGYSMKSHE